MTLKIKKPARLHQAGRSDKLPAQLAQFNKCFQPTKAQALYTELVAHLRNDQLIIFVKPLPHGSGPLEYGSTV